MKERDSGEAVGGLAESVGRAVEREHRRRKRLLALYLGLLAIPVISAAALIGLELQAPDTIELASPPADERFEAVSDTMAQLRASFGDQERRLSQLQARLQRMPITNPSAEPIPDRRIDELMVRVQELESRLARMEARNRQLTVTVDSLQRQLRRVN